MHSFGNFVDHTDALPDDTIAELVNGRPNLGRAVFIHFFLFTSVK
jgi:hypothetical protein